VDQLLNFSETWPARVLLLMAHFWKEGRLDAVIATISQDTLVEMIGTTSLRVSLFLNKFRKMGFIDSPAGCTHTVPSSSSCTPSPLITADLGAETESICLRHQFLSSEQF
jgi:hypothetical protein